MKVLHWAAAAAISSFLVASAANAATYIKFSPPAGDGSISGVFGNDGVSGSGSLTDTITFTWPSAGSTAGSVTTSATKLHGSIVADTNIDFTSVTLDGQPFALSGPGQFESGTIFIPTASGTQTLVITYNSGGAGATYAGTLAFTPTAVPEPTTWALLTAGLVLTGIGLRSRRQAFA